MDRRADRGSATVWVVVIIALVWAVTSAVVVVGAARVARHQAQAAADLSAIAGAAWTWADPERACASAGLTSRAYRARLRSCQVMGEVVEVIVDVPYRTPIPGLPSVAVGRARAGPAHGHGPDG